VDQASLVFLSQAVAFFSGAHLDDIHKIATADHGKPADGPVRRRAFFAVPAKRGRPHDKASCVKTFTAYGKTYQGYDIQQLSVQQMADMDRLPFSIRMY